MAGVSYHLLGQKLLAILEETTSPGDQLPSWHLPVVLSELVNNLICSVLDHFRWSTANVIYLFFYYTANLTNLFSALTLHLDCECNMSSPFLGA